MKQWIRIFSVLAVLAAPIAGSAQIGSAAPLPAPAAHTVTVTQELHITAIVPAHRDIILDTAGNISKIISNTPEDVTPDVYLLDTIPANKRPLTDDLYKQYRKLVSYGTAKYGVLYQRPLPTFLASILSRGTL